MLAIKLSRVGKKHQPSYRIVVLEKTKDPWGDNLENVGFYNPMVNPKVIELKADRIKHWISKGAQPTDTVWNLLVKEGIVEGKRRKAHSGNPKPKEEAKQQEVKKEVPVKEETKQE